VPRGPLQEIPHNNGLKPVTMREISFTKAAGRGKKKIDRLTDKMYTNIYVLERARTLN
jgi:hypothetical protein